MRGTLKCLSLPSKSLRLKVGFGKSFLGAPGLGATLRA
jgi:hypothetical protein